ncbi:hypothetical protein, partial [Burkholderia cenocepacia]|uniref:hypothetical protein n=1 Tax=Burkholderia cenocepacia TaxID=95486 RepID=UPI001ABA8A7D
ISDTVSMMVLQKDKILTQRSPLSEDRADHPIKRHVLRRVAFFLPCARTKKVAWLAATAA